MYLLGEVVRFVAPVHWTNVMDLLLLHQREIDSFIDDIINGRFVRQITENQVKECEEQKRLVNVPNKNKIFGCVSENYSKIRGDCIERGHKEYHLRKQGIRNKTGSNGKPTILS